MKVLMLADGTSIHTMRVLDWHIKNGCDVTFIDYTDPKLATQGIYRFVPYPRLRGAKFLRGVIGHSFTSHLIDRAAAMGLRRIFRRIRPDVVHLYQIDWRAYHCLQAGFSPLVMSSWGTDINQHFSSTADPAFRCRTAKAVAGADLIIADSTDIVDKCVHLAGKSVAAELLPLGVDTELFRPGYEKEARNWRRELEIPDDAPVLLSIRALTPLYRHDHILSAFHRAQSRFQKKPFLVFKVCGKEASDRDRVMGYKSELCQQAERFGIADWIRWSERVRFEQLPSLYAAADVIVNYPSMDGFPVTFLEAAACMCPVITNRLPSYVGTFAEKYFYIVETGDLNALANEMVKVVNGIKELSRARLEAARAIVERSYNESVSAQRLMAIYGDLTARTNGRRSD